jgi:hypothetical protein
MSILASSRKKGSQLFRGKFGETSKVRVRRGEQMHGGWSFAEKSAKPGYASSVAAQDVICVQRPIA